MVLAWLKVDLRTHIKSEDVIVGILFSSDLVIAKKNLTHLLQLFDTNKVTANYYWK